MRPTSNSHTLVRHNARPSEWMCCAGMFVSFLILTFSIASAEAPGQQAFPTCEAAGSALVAAAKADDIKALAAILGPDAQQILSSGDPVADNNEREKFVQNYQEMHRYAYDQDGRVSLIVGAENWPMPIPLIKQNDGWIFDTTAAKDELLYRRIGRNELFTVKVLKDLVDAQQEYKAAKSEYAEKILSDTGTENGLYWPVAEGQPESPIGPLVANASLEGYKRTPDASPMPFHGYYYKELMKQGKNAPGGAKKYEANGKMTNGFAYLAYPAEYRSSGVVTFMVSQNGTIVQKDLGPDTAKLAGEVMEFNPDNTWDQDTN